MSGRGWAYVESAGLVTAVGLRARAVAAAARAGISRCRESALYNAGGDPFVLSLVPEEIFAELGPADSSRADRILALAGAALREAAAPLAGKRNRAPVPILFAGPEPLGKSACPLDRALIDRLGEQAQLSIAPSESRVEASGAAGGVRAIARAIELLESGAAERVLVGAADCPLDQLYLETLDGAGRARTETSLDAYTPGEGAAFLLLTSRPSGQALARAAIPGLGEERGHRASAEPHTGDGLAEAIHEAASRAGTPAQSILAALNGESFLAKEWGVAMVRNHALLDRDAAIDHPAEAFGDLGAAMGIALVALAAVDISEGRRRAPCLAWAASEGSLRAAVIVDRARTETLAGTGVDR